MSNKDKKAKESITPDNQVFKYMANDESPIDFSNPDYTGASADYYVNKFTNRPEDMGNIKAMQGILSKIGMVPGIGEPADMINAGIYASQGNLKEAALYASGIGAIGGLKNTENYRAVLKTLQDFGFTNVQSAIKSIQESGASTLKGYTDWFKKSKAPAIEKRWEELSIEEKLMKIMDDPEKSKNFLDNASNVMKENVKKYRK